MAGEFQPKLERSNCLGGQMRAVVGIRYTENMTPFLLDQRCLGGESRELVGHHVGTASPRLVVVEDACG